MGGGINSGALKSDLVKLPQQPFAGLAIDLQLRTPRRAFRVIRGDAGCMSPEKQETQAQSVITFSCESEEASSVLL